MATLNTDLRSVPALTRQELLHYIVERFPEAALNIVTNAGLSYFGTVLNYGTVKNAEAFLIIQIRDDRGNLLDRFLHLDVHKIESIELINPEDALAVFSRGSSIKNNAYEPSGKIEVRRAFQQFQKSILASTGINVGIPQIELPADGLALNRILKHTHIIQAALIDLLREEDAGSSWKSAFTGIAFANSDHFQVSKAGTIVEIHFPFENVSAPEMSAKELAVSVMGVL